jgi:hypothetical protein
MMRTAKLITDYGKYGDAMLNQKALNVKMALTENANFPVTLPTLADFTLLQQQFDTALSKSSSADRIQIAIKNQARLALIAAMRQLALDIDAKANGDKAKLISSGLDLAASGDSSSAITAPSDFRIVDGLNSGELKFSCKRVPNAISYVFEYTDELPTEDTKWKSLSSSSREVVVRGLRGNVRIYSRVRAVGTKGQEANSEILSRVVQ